MSQPSMIVKTPGHSTVRTLSRTFVRKTTSSGSPSPTRNARRAFALIDRHGVRNGSNPYRAASAWSMS